MVHRFSWTILLAASLLYVTPALLHAVMPQNPIPGGSSAEDLEEPFNQGWIDWYEDGTIVIDDTQYTITTETSVFDKDEVSVGVDYLSVDMEVVFKADDEYKLTYVREKIDPDGNQSGSLSISEQRTIQSTPEEEVETAPVDTQTPGEIYQEGGVWKN